MRAIAIKSFESGPAPVELPLPEPGPDEVLVRVHASSVNPVDSAIAAGITALTAIDALELAQGATLMVVGAVGSVGSLAIQLAAAAGATVVAPALPEAQEFLPELGVTHVCRARGTSPSRFGSASPDGVIALLDLVSYTPGTHDAAIKDGAPVASTNNAAGDGPGRTNVMAMPTTDNLRRLAQLLDTETLKVPVEGTYELDRADEALQALAEGTRRASSPLTRAFTSGRWWFRTTDVRLLKAVR